MTLNVKYTLDVPVESKCVRHYRCNKRRRKMLDCYKFEYTSIKRIFWCNEVWLVGEI